MYYPEEIIEEVRRRNNIVDVVAGYVRLQKKGGSHWGLCPFHSERTPSFSVNGDKQIYHCFGCGAGGNVYTFLMNYENYSFPEAVRALAERAGVQLPEPEDAGQVRQRESRRARLLEINKEAAKFFYFQLRSPGGEIGYRYLKKRELTDETMRIFGLGYAVKNSSALIQYLRGKGFEDELLKEAGIASFSEKYGMTSLFWNRVMFPIQDSNNRVIGFGGRVMGEGEPKYLNSPETPVFDKRRNLYGLNYARRARSANMILCEGYMDVIAMHQAGFTQAVASLGTAFTPEQAALLGRYTDSVLLAYDSDGAGVKAALRAVGILREAGISGKVINMRPYKDPDEFIKNMGADAFRERIDKAKNSFLFEIDVLKREYQLEDPEQKTRFYNAAARKLLEFEEALERDNYIQAVAREHMIPYEDLRRLVNRLGSMPGEVRKAARERQAQAVREERQNQKKKEKDDGSKKAQRLLLTWLIERQELIEKVEGIIAPEDFTEPLYRQVASLVFEGHRGGKVNPAEILNHFIQDEEQSRQVAGLFHARLGAALGNEEQQKAFSDVVYRVKKNSLDYASRNASDIGELQRIIQAQAELGRITIMI